MQSERTSYEALTILPGQVPPAMLRSPLRGTSVSLISAEYSQLDFVWKGWRRRSFDTTWTSFQDGSGGVVIPIPPDFPKVGKSGMRASSRCGQREPGPWHSDLHFESPLWRTSCLEQKATTRIWIDTVFGPRAAGAHFLSLLFVRRWHLLCLLGRTNCCILRIKAKLHECLNDSNNPNVPRPNKTGSNGGSVPHQTIHNYPWFTHRPANTNFALLV
jgi:hypothetical protein